MIKGMKNKVLSILVITALIVVVGIFVIVMGNGSNDEIDQERMDKVDSLYSIWLDVAGPSDKVNLQNNKDKYTREIYDKLTDAEIAFLTEYSENFKILKNEPSLLTPTAITMGGYLVQNFNAMKQIAAKTSLKDYLTRFGVNIGNRMYEIM